jgi:hypothetical protein
MKFRYAFLVLMLIVSGSSAHADTQPFYQSLVGAIQRANAQADITLMKGIWRTTLGDSTATWNIPTLVRATLILNYENGLVKNSSLDLTTAIVVEIKASGGICTKVKVKTLRYDASGKVDPKSDYKIIGAAPCNDLGGLIAFEDHFRLETAPANLFSGKLLVSLNSSPDRPVTDVPVISKCEDLDCKKSQRSKGPISIIEFFKIDNGKEPFEVVFEAGKRIYFPGEGSIKLRAGSVLVSRLFYDVVNDRGYGTLRTLDLLIDEGLIVAGNVKLAIPPSVDSKIKFENVDISKNGQSAAISGGEFRGKLDRGSYISIGGPEGRDSRLSVQLATAKLDGIDVRYTPNSRSMSVRGGSIEGLFQEANLYFQKASYLNLTPVNLHFTFGCALGDTEPKCLPAYWGPEGTRISGTIDSFGTSVSSGQIEFSKHGAIRLDSGSTVAFSGLFVDTRNKAAPIRGIGIDVALKFSAQDFWLDDKTMLTAAQVTLKSNNLAFTDEDRYPTGDMVVVDGSLQAINNDIVGSIPMVTSEFSANLHRKARENIGLTDGKLTGAFSVIYGDGGQGHVDLKLTDFFYKDGNGDGVVNLTAQGLSDHIDTESKPEETKKGVTITVHSARIDLALEQPFKVVNAKLRIKNGSWTLDRQQSSIRVKVDVPYKKIVDLSVDKAIHLCSAEAYSKQGTYFLSGTADYEIAPNQKRLTIGDFTLNENLAFEADASSCKRVAVLICGVLGEMIPVVGPIAGIAGAYICGDQVDKVVAEKSNEFRAKANKKIRDFKYTIVR